MDITEAQLTWLFRCCLIVAMIVGYPALTTAIALMRAERTLGKLFWSVITAFDRRPWG